MVQLLELDNGNIVLFNDENITEEEVIEYLTNGEFSSRYIRITSNQYENVFKPKNSPIKEVLKEKSNEEANVDCVNAKRCTSCGSNLCSEVCASYVRNGSLVKDLRDWEINCNYIVLIDNQNRDKILYEGEVNRVLETIFRENMHLLYYFIIEASRVVMPEEDVDKFICYIDERR